MRHAPTSAPQPDDLDFVLAVARGAADLVRAELEPLDAAERRAVGDIVNAARLLTGEDVSRGAALTLAVEFVRHAGLCAAQQRLDATNGEGA